MALMSEAGWLFLLRWIHFLSGITWIGLLYYFNFVQTPFFAETEAPVRTGAQQKLLPRAMWWFRWGAMITFISGWLYLLHWWIGKVGFAAGVGAWAILLGGLLGSIMWANVWFIIHPKQKIVIQNALDVGAGKPANPAAAPAGARAGLASRTNTMLSIPMLFFMGAASHLQTLRIPRLGRVRRAPRTNTILSIPMLFFMGAASHLQTLGMPRSGVVFWVGAVIIMLLVE